MNSGINWLILILVAWAIVAYLLIPWLSKLYYRRHFTDGPRITVTSDGHPLPRKLSEFQRDGGGLSLTAAP